MSDMPDDPAAASLWLRKRLKDPELSDPVAAAAFIAAATYDLAAMARRLGADDLAAALQQANGHAETVMQGKSPVP